MPFAALALGACLLMTRVARATRAAPGSTDPRLLGLGVLLGLAALTRNEADLARRWSGRGSRGARRGTARTRAGRG